MSVKTSRFTLELPSSELNRMKKVASTMGTSVKDLLRISFEDFVNREPNKETLKAMKQAETGKGVKKFKSAKELFDHLGM